MRVRADAARVPRLGSAQAGRTCRGWRCERERRERTPDGQRGPVRDVARRSRTLGEARGTTGAGGHTFRREDAPVMTVLVAGHGARVLCRRGGWSINDSVVHNPCVPGDGGRMIVAACPGCRPVEQAERHEEQEEQRDDSVCAARARLRVATGTRRVRMPPPTVRAIARAVYGVGAQSHLCGIMHPRVDLHSSESRRRRGMYATCRRPSPTPLAGGARTLIYYTVD